MPRHAYKFYLGLLATVPPIATDMYLPAMPRLAELWNVPTSRVHLSLTLWFVAYSLTLLVWGGYSDRWGRRPILLAGLSLFVVSSGFCGLAQNVYQLIIARMFQGAAAAGAASMVMAIARDRFEGRDRQHVLAWIGIILGVAPMVAPSLGAAILDYADWRFIFAAQAGIAAFTLLVSLGLYKETAPYPRASSVLEMLTAFTRLLKNRNYMLANGATGLLCAPLFAFIAFSPIAYIQHFGMSNQKFGLVFGANALATMLGSASCAFMLRRVDEGRLLSMSLIGSLVGGIAVLLIGHTSWVMFAAGMMVFSFAFGMSRPLVNHLVLEQVDRDIGTASSALVCYQFICGAAGMAVATQDWSHPFLVFGVLAASCPLVTLLLWPLIRRRTNHGLPQSDEAALPTDGLPPM